MAWCKPLYRAHGAHPGFILPRRTSRTSSYALLCPGLFCACLACKRSQAGKWGIHIAPCKTDPGSWGRCGTPHLACAECRLRGELSSWADQRSRYDTIRTCPYCLPSPFHFSAQHRARTEYEQLRLRSIRFRVFGRASPAPASATKLQLQLPVAEAGADEATVFQLPPLP